jgi:hypothetical protein
MFEIAGFKMKNREAPRRRAAGSRFNPNAWISPIRAMIHGAIFVETI